MPSSRILVIFETSVIRHPDFPHGSINFGINYNTVNDYVKSSGLKNSVDFGITKMTYEELLYGRKSEYEDVIKKLGEQEKLLENVPGVSISIKQEDFSYDEYFRNLLDDFLKKEKIKVISYPNTSLLNSVISRSLKKEKPFITTGHHSDYGFKDVIIWESILSYRGCCKYNKVIFLANDKGFTEDCKREFISKHNTYFKILRDPDAVTAEIKETNNLVHVLGKGLSYEIIKNNKKEIQDDLRERDFQNLLNSDYIKEGILNFVVSNYDGSVTKKDLKISKPPYILEDWVVDEEIVGKVVLINAIIRGKKVLIDVFINDMNGIDDYEIND